MPRRLYKHNDLATYMRVKRLRWARRMVRMFDNRIQKRILEGSLGGRRSAGKLRNRWEDEVWKDGTILLNMKNWRTASRRRNDWRDKICEAKARKRAEDPQEEDESCPRRRLYLFTYVHVSPYSIYIFFNPESDFQYTIHTRPLSVRTLYSGSCLIVVSFCCHNLDTAHGQRCIIIPTFRKFVLITTPGDRPYYTDKHSPSRSFVCGLVFGTEFSFHRHSSEHCYT
jgi:hypothetical protein